MPHDTFPDRFAADADWDFLRAQVAAELETLRTAVYAATARQYTRFLARFEFSIQPRHFGRYAVVMDGYEWQEKFSDYQEALEQILSALVGEYTITELLDALQHAKHDQ